MRPKRAVHVAFANQGLKAACLKLGSGRYEDMRLFESLNAAIAKLRQNPLAGVQVPRTLWPASYIKSYGVDNLWKLNLPGAWRLVYTVRGNEVEILAVLVEWMTHKEYERRFGYGAR